jgi:hypothetical protein
MKEKSLRKHILGESESGGKMPIIWRKSKAVSLRGIDINGIG